MHFQPIAIVGQSCILPGALDPGELWDAVLQSRDMVSPAPAGYWRLDPAAILTTANGKTQDRTWSDRGGYVRGFDERFDPTGFTLPASAITTLDPSFQWVLHGVREALRSAGMAAPQAYDAPPVGLVLGNLSYPTFGLVEFAESTWFAAQTAGIPQPPPGQAAPDPRNRFSSGLPAHLAAAALNLKGEAFALDAACASSLYAIKLACDRLQDGRYRTMVAGAVNRTDDLFIHIGFCALQAMSRRGESRPFAADADGLVPAEGAAFVVLKRLADAVADGDPILGVIRGIGLSNDGNAGGFLSPAAAGQVRAMQAAYAMAGLSPASISLLECHATGTPVGDATEIQSAAEIFQGTDALPIGSLKANLGHLITAAGAAGLLKLLGALRTGIRPPSRPVTTPLAALAASPFRLLQAPEPWETPNGAPRRAAISAFGFGGNNAHLIVEEWNPAAPPISLPPPTVSRAIAIVDIETTVGPYQTIAAFGQALLLGREGTTLNTVDVDMTGLRFPPNDLKQTLPQQLLILEVARRLAARNPSLPKAATAVLIGMGCDPEIARYGVRWRLEDWAKGWQEREGDSQKAGQENAGNQQWIAAAKAALIPGLEAAGVVGTMPNIPANRINTQLDYLGPSHTISAEELSGMRAFTCAVDALRRGEIDAALVGAVDLSVEAVHQAAAAQLFDAQRQIPGDAAVILLLKRVEDAARDGDAILAIVDDDPPTGQDSLAAGASGDGRGDEQLALGLAAGLPALSRSFGHAHAASGLLHVAVAALCLREHVRLTGDTDGKLLPAEPWLSATPRTARVQVDAFGGQTAALTLTAGTAAPQWTRTEEAVRMHVFSGPDATAVLQSLARTEESNTGPARLVIIARDANAFAVQRQRAQEALAQKVTAGQATTSTPQPIAKGIYWSAAPMAGALGFVFTPAAAAYQGMGRELLLALPEVADHVVQKFPCLVRTQHWLTPARGQGAADPFQVLQGCAMLSQMHAFLTQSLLGIKPAAVLGVSSGETNSMFATGAWRDMDAMFAEIDLSGMYTREIAGEYRTAQRAWPDQRIDWAGWRVLAPVAEVEAALQDEPYAYLTMINAPADCLVAGQANACQRVVDKIGRTRCVQNEGEIVAHHPALQTWAPEWRAIHCRTTYPVANVRFYSNARGGAYPPDQETIADALTDQATAGVDFRRVVEAAWADGVRIFVEHGPRNVCSGWIRNILGDREHLAVALDRPQNGVDQLLDAVAQLVAAGVPVDYAALTAALAAPTPTAAPPPTQPRRVLSFPAHYPPVTLPPLTRQPAPQAKPAIQMIAPIHTAASGEKAEMHSTVQRMDPPPPLPPVLSSSLSSRPPVTLPAPPPVPVRVALPPTPVPAAAQSAARPTQPAPPPAQPIAPALPEPVRHQLVEQLTYFHTQVSAAHQIFLAQQQRAMARLVALHNNIGVIPDPLTNVRSSAEPSPQNWGAGGANPAPIPSAASAPPLTYPGPKFNRQQLEHLASGKISELLGPIFAQQDHFRRQVRMPMPPLLLADRMLGIAAEAGAVGQKGIIWTETDVTADAWYLHNGHIAAGVLIEAGQADLLLVSYLGADFVNKGERVYRLLGCEATFHAPLPVVGDTLQYEIHVDGYAQQGPVRLFFFHYDCTIDGALIFSVRQGQAGFFTDEELDASNGVIWDPHTAEHAATARVDPPALICDRSAFSAEQVTAFSEGRVVDCFGAAFRATQSHVRTPTVARGRMLLFDEVTAFDPQGGPWGRGYLRAEDHIAPDEWFFAGHFKNDPCMPGTLMLEGCLQTMAFYMAGLGYTVDRDGWRFEPAHEEAYKLICRGQVIPSNKTVVYEVFVEEVIDGPIPTLYADLLCTVDGLAAFHCRRMGLRLIPAFPLESRPSLLEGPELCDLDPARNARTPDHVYDPRSIAACAWGKPSDAFGPLFARFDGPQRCPRLPGPPYLFMTRITALDAQKGVPVTGGTLEAEYQIPPDAWYFAENGSRTMPYAVLLEAALQPCGWFASYKGSVLQSEEELFFRNLDGTATQFGEVFPEDGVLRTHVTNTSVSRLGSMTIIGFDVECFVAAERVFAMTTNFGFFPKEALAGQAGLPVSDAQRANLHEPCDFRRELRSRPPRYFGGSLALPGPMLLLLDRVSGYWPEGGQLGLGRLRAEIDVNPQDWFFKCHFMGDSVQPGSLGLEAMLQALQFYMLEAGLGAGIERPRFEPIQLDEAMTWKYRGQVLPTTTRVTVEIEITEKGQAPTNSVPGAPVTAAYAIADASLWVDGLRIYSATRLGMRIVADETALHTGGDERLDPAHDRWLQDHCPTWTVPALAMMSMVDRLAAGALLRAPGRQVSGLRNVRVHRWLGFAEGAQTVKTVGVPKGADTVAMQLLVWEEAPRRYTLVASGDVILTEHWQIAGGAWPALASAPAAPNPYAAGALFHGPAYQLLTELRQDGAGASFWLDLDASAVPVGVLNQGLLDAATHGIPHDAMHRWSAEIPPGVAAYPIAITAASFHSPTPTRGRVRCEARFAGFRGDDRQFPMVHVQIITGQQVWAEFELVETLFAKGPLGQGDAQTRQAFLQAHTYVPELSLSQFDGTTTTVAVADVKASDWLAGTVAAIYGVDAGGRLAALDQLAQVVAIKEHVARKVHLHPAELTVLAIAPSDPENAPPPDTSSFTVSARAQPLNPYRVLAQRDGNAWQVSDAQDFVQGGLDVRCVQDFWRPRINSGATLVEDLTLALMRRFLRSVVIEDPAAFTALHGRGVLYLANHQLDLESALFVSLLAGVQGTVTTAIARQELGESWIGPFFDICFQHPTIADPKMLLLIDRASPEAVFEALDRALERTRDQQNSLLVHVEGQHALQARQPVEVVSTALIDLAVAKGVPIVPVRFAGGLPVEPVAEPLAFPAGYGQQDIWIGAPLLPAQLAAQSSAARKSTVLAALNGFGDRWQTETPNPGDEDFAAAVASWRQTHAVTAIQAALFRTLEAAAGPSAETQWLLARLHGNAVAPDKGTPDAPLQQWLRTVAEHLFGLPLDRLGQ